MSVETQIAVLEEKTDSLSKKTDVLFSVVKEHMDEEAKDRKELIKTIEALDKRVQKIDEVQSKNKAFIGGVIFAVSAIWAATLAIVHYFK